MWSALAYWSQHTSAFVCMVLSWKQMTDHATLWSPEALLSQTLCSHAKGSFLFEGRLECLYSTIREMCHRQSFLTSCLSRNISTHITFWESQTDWQRWRVLAHGLFICQEKYVQIPLGMLSVSGQFWKGWLVSHREPTCLPARFSFNFWPWVKMAASHTGRLGSQSDQFSGSQETSASLSLSLCLSLSNHLFGACGRGSRNGELCLVLLRFNHSLQRVSCFSLSRWQRGGKWSSTPPRLNSCTSDPDETDISLHLHCPSSSLAAHAELFIKKEQNFTKNIIGRSQTQSSAFS